MRVHPLVAVLTLAVLTLAPASCSGTGGSPSRSASPGTASPSTADAPQAAERIAPNASCAVVGDLEGAFKKSSQMKDYFACIVPGIEQWIDAVRPNTPHPTYNFVATGATGVDHRCQYDDQTLAYCPASGNVYFGEQALWTQYTKHGDASAALILAHEVTHHFQALANVPPAQVAHEQIRYEDQADCGGGTFIQFATKKGWLKLRDDIIDLAGTLAAAGSAPGPGRSHGTTTERIAAVGRGVLGAAPNPLKTCNRYVPEVPLVP